MDGFQFSATIERKNVVCSVTVPIELDNPVFCFSLMAPPAVVSGGELIYSLGGYGEVQLPRLAANAPHDFVLAYENDSFRPANRAWLPLGAYLRCGQECYALPALAAGVRRDPRADSPSGKVALKICPQPNSFRAKAGLLMTVGFASDSEALLRVDALFRRMDLGPAIDNSGTTLVTSEDSSLPTEGYRLSIRPSGVQLDYSERKGAFYGCVTLATLLHHHKGKIPCGTIEDAPRFEWRGQHLDCARHFFEVETILDLLDVMALLKLNRFHWHFSDDEAFRLELQSLPELAHTHFRGENELVPGVFGGGIRSGGGYSRADAERILDHARALEIEVMPEIEVPAHALALAKVYPAARDPEDTGTEKSVQGYEQNVLNPAIPESWRVWEAMVSEMSEIFPFGVLHLGGDELPEHTWSGSPAARELKMSEGLETTLDLQGWTMNRLAEFARAKGKTPAGWEESALGKRGIENDAILFSWTGSGPGLEAARMGYRVVMTPAQHTYLDMAHSTDVDDWGANWAATIPLGDTIAWEPVPPDELELEKKIIGVQGAFWSEFTCRDEEMKPMVFPRILGIATTAWQKKGSAKEETLHCLAEGYGCMLHWQGKL